LEHVKGNTVIRFYFYFCCWVLSTQVCIYNACVLCGGGREPGKVRKRENREKREDWNLDRKRKNPREERAMFEFMVLLKIL